MVRAVSIARLVEITASWMLALLWIAPLLYALWATIHPSAYATRFDLAAPLTTANLAAAWDAAPFPRYLLNTFLLVTLILAAQFLLCTPAAYAFARMRFPGRDILFALVLLQLMIAPDVLLVANYGSIARLGLVDSSPWSSATRSTPGR